MQKFIGKLGSSDSDNIDIYFAKYDQEKQNRLTIIRTMLFERFPNATERIYYGIPTVELNGKIILQYAAYKHHISFLISYDLSSLLKKIYPQYKYTDYSVIFPDNQPFPNNFIKDIYEML